MRVLGLVPAFQAERTVGEVVRLVAQQLASDWPVLVVDDGSSDATAERARAAGAEVLAHPRNRGKGAAIRTGLTRAVELGADAVVTVDADGQHPADQAALVARVPAPASALVLGVRDLVAAGAPSANRFSNGFSNVFLSLFSGLRLSDTQCGLRRYPARATLELAPRADGYAFEAEIVLRAARAKWPIVEVPVRVIYPPESERISHFHSVRDPARIVARVLHTFATAPRAK